MLDIGDYIAAGAIGLVQALRRYDSRRGVLVTWLRAKIDLAMTDYHRDVLKTRRRHPPRFVRFDTTPTVEERSGTPCGRPGQRRENMIDPGFVDDRIGRDSFDDLVSTLKQRERHVLYRYFVQGVPQTKIGREIGINESAVSQMIKRTLAKLRIRLGTGETMAVVG